MREKREAMARGDGALGCTAFRFIARGTEVPQLAAVTQRTFAIPPSGDGSRENLLRRLWLGGFG